jgi:hypothetical protein
MHVFVPGVSLTPGQAVGRFGDPFLAAVFAADAPVSSDRTTREIR